MDSFVTVVNCLISLLTVAKHSIVDDCGGPDYSYRIFQSLGKNI